MALARGDSAALTSGRWGPDAGTFKAGYEQLCGVVLAASYEPRAFGVRSGMLAHLPAPLRPATTFAYITGWRIDSDVLPLEWRQVDFGAGEVRLDPGKIEKGEGRTFPMTRELREVLEEQRAITENLQRQLKVVCPRVFHRSGRPIESFRVAFRSACKEAGCPDRVPRDFRRTAVRNLVRARIPERVAMQMTGHKTRSVFERYSLREAARRLYIARGTISGTIEETGGPARKSEICNLVGARRRHGRVVVRSMALRRLPIFAGPTP